MRLRKDVRGSPNAKKRVWGPLVCGSAITTVGIILYVEATRSIGKLGYDVLDSPFFPKLGAVMLVLFGIALTVTSLLKPACTKRFGEGRPTEAKKPLLSQGPKQVVCFITLLVLYSLLLNYIGFIFSSVFFIITSYLLISQRRKIRDLIEAVVFAFSTTIVLWLIFAKGLKLLLP